MPRGREAAGRRVMMLVLIVFVQLLFKRIGDGLAINHLDG